jgi:hypothetical protein
LHHVFDQMTYPLDSAHHFAPSPAPKAKSSPMFQRAAVTLFMGLAALSLNAGVSVSQPIASSELPAAWSNVIQPHGQQANAIAGTYRDQGQWLWHPNRPPAKGSLVRSVLLMTDAEFRALGLEVPDEVEIRQVDPAHIQVRGRRNGVATLTRTVEIRSSSELEGVTIERSATEANPSVAAVVGTRLSARLFKGSDGRLYAHLKTEAAGVAFLLPMSSNIEAWGRWDPTMRMP